MGLHHDIAARSEKAMNELQKIIDANKGIDAKAIKEHDSCFVRNPTSEDFSWKFGGETYGIRAGEIKPYGRNVARHLAKHLSTKMIVEKLERTMTKKEREDKNAPIHVRISQLSIYDTHERRIALYEILGNESLVEAVVTHYPFKGFIGDMALYRKFLDELSL